MTDTKARDMNEPDAKTREERRYYKRAGIQKEGRTAKAYKKQYAPLKWPCPICTPRAPMKRTAEKILESSYPSKKALAHHYTQAHGG